MDKQPMPGDRVIYHDPVGTPHEALCTTNWGSCINVVFISSDENKKDTYGRQIERESSVSHKLNNTAHGRYWRWPDEVANGFTAPVAS